MTTATGWTPYGDPTNGAEIVTVEIDCHAYAFHLTDPEYPECGPDNLTRIAETYGVLIRYLDPDDPTTALGGVAAGWLDWAWWYRISGPRDNIARFYVDEYCGCEITAAEMVRDGAMPYDPSIA